MWLWINLIVKCYNLPIEGFITTNYDQLFEQAVIGGKSEIAILPYSPNPDSQKWLLKMHGCIEYPDDIVLTRSSYNRYTERNQALAGIVQAMLITRKMLFLGFSLSDENFLRIVDAVRRAIAPVERKTLNPVKIGSAIMLYHDPILEKHWSNELTIYSPSDSTISIPEASRRMEIFFDYLLLRTGATKHFLNPRFFETLDDYEKKLHTDLINISKSLPGNSVSPIWNIIKDTLIRFGFSKNT